MDEKKILVGKVIPLEDELISSPINAPRRRVLDAFQKKIGITFNRMELLNVALTHSSYSRSYDKVFSDNEKLEFMGDAVLELASSTYIFKRFPSLDEGELTKLRATVVCQSSLAKIARRLKLGNLMQFDYGEGSTGGARRESILEDAFEAVVGAIYLDKGWETARDFAIAQLKPELENLTDENVAAELQRMVQKNLSDYKSKLQETLMKENPQVKIEYVEINASGPSHQPTFEQAVKIDGKIMGKGVAGNKKLAEQMAAKIALKKVESQIKVHAESADEKISEVKPNVQEVPTDENFKSKLQECLMKNNPNAKIEYVEISAGGSPHQPTFEYAVKIEDKILGQGVGGSKKSAEQMAAKQAFQNLKV